MAVMARKLMGDGVLHLPEDTPPAYKVRLPDGHGLLLSCMAAIASSAAMP
jgi:hypothetical protein